MRTHVEIIREQGTQIQEAVFRGWQSICYYHMGCLLHLRLERAFPPRIFSLSSSMSLWSTSVLWTIYFSAQLVSFFSRQSQVVKGQDN